ncbi:type VII secretion protein EccB [Aeromicrobium stalagmiti]|uniref:type VII secretion protein EccB n=1 Tax=Aeromicrobium stalagmiti TaxID=2738988 RepID=UPI001568D71D|nr:type VII secretion protein EccB [Aeromicrobium stalagmiti]NRQ48616.1 type VII secretion protein EccB [Aeromicrobium stalagmiti]
MASKRDLVEAHDFNRRRLVTAFLSGAPGGREVEPVRYGRTIIGGLVLAAILVAGAAVAGVLKPTVSDDWRENGLVIGKESGSRYLMFEKQLYPVANITSARLALQDELKISYVPDDVLVKEPKRNAIGIVNAPDYLPPANRLVQDGWTACTNGDGGLRTVVSTRSGAERSTGTALLVKSRDDGKYWIVSGSRRYPVPKGNVGTAIVRALGLDTTTAFPGTNRWLDLLPIGSTVTAFTVPGSGSSVDSGVPGLDVIGTRVQADGRDYVLVKGGLVLLQPFAAAIYSVSPGTVDADPVELDPTDFGRIQTLNSAKLFPADWPKALPSTYSEQTPCLVLGRAEQEDDTSRAYLATPTEPSIVPTGAEASAEVQQGRGALVYGSTRTSGGPVDTEYLIDSLATRYAIEPKNAAAEAQRRLGYGDVEPVPVPRTWTELFRDGPALDATKAGAPVG